MINLRNKKVDFVNSTTINDAKNYRLISFKKEGKCEQEVIEEGKNIFNIGATPINTRYATTTSIENGIRVTTQEAESGSLSNKYVVYSLLDLSNNKYLGKTIRMKCNFIASGENQAKYSLVRSNGVGTTSVANATYDENNKTISYTVGEITDDRTNLVVFFYGNDNSQTSVAGDYVDYTNIIITIDNEDMTYEPYKIPSPSPDNPSEIKSIKGANLLKGLSTPSTDTDYWYQLSSTFTSLEDGWGRFEYDNTNGTSTVFLNAIPKMSAVKLKENTEYVVFVEIRNSLISENSGALLQVSTSNAPSAFNTYRAITYQSINSGVFYRSTLTTKSLFDNTILRGLDTALRLPAGTKGTVEARISLFESSNAPETSNYIYIPFNNIQVTVKQDSSKKVLNIDLKGNELCSLPDGTKDELIIENGRAKLIKKIKKIILNGDGIYASYNNYHGEGKCYCYQNNDFALIPVTSQNYKHSICSHFKNRYVVWGYSSSKIGTYSDHATVHRKYFISDKLTVAEFKEWLQDNPVTLQYLSETPTEIDLGAVILPETFEGINNINVSSNLDSNTSIVYVNEIVEFKSSLVKVYDSSEKTFTSNGIKTLHPLLAEVTKKDNGDYYLELRDTLDNLDYYQKGMIIRCTTPWGVQGFRCDNPIINNKRIECKAWHLSYDSKNYIIKDAYAVDKNCNDALDHLNSSTDKTSPFTCVSDIAKIVSTRAVRKTLFEVYEWLITDEKYGGHWYRDNWNLSIKSSIGEDRGVVLAQNKNITDMKISENWDDVCTKILPYTTDGENAILLDDTYVEVGEELYDLPYSKVIKFENQLKQEDYETYDAFLSATKTWLEAQANSYLQENKFPKINYSVSAKIDNISDVGDVIHVKHPKCKVDITTNVIGITYDVNRDKYIKIEFGNFKKEIKNLAQEISETVKKDTENKIEETKNLLQKELEDSTSKINNTFGNSYVIYEGDKILVVDTLPKENAKYVIKISNGGIGFSQNGINGTFTSAWTIDGTLNMQNINVINLTASLIKGGTLKLGGLNNSSGTFELYDETGRLMLLEDKTGLTVYALNGDYVKLNADVGFAGYNKNDVKIYWADGEVFHMRNAEVENELKVAGMIKFVPVNTSDNRGIGIVAIPG